MRETMYLLYLEAIIVIIDPVYFKMVISHQKRVVDFAYIDIYIITISKNT